MKDLRQADHGLCASETGFPHRFDTELANTPVSTEPCDALPWIPHFPECLALLIVRDDRNPVQQFIIRPMIIIIINLHSTLGVEFLCRGYPIQFDGCIYVLT